MRAAQFHEFGPPDVLHTTALDAPMPGPGEVLIDVEYAGITFVETQLRAGSPPVEAMRPELPAVLGNAVAGTVAEVGADVPASLLGARVASSLSGRGGYAEQAVADARRPISVPDTLGSDQAAALIADGRTALALMAAIGDVADRTVLVDAAGGGVGSLLVQLITAAGGRVVAIAGHPDKLALAADLGAAVAINYADPSWPTAVRSEAGEIDVALDGIGGPIAHDVLSLLRPGGMFCGFGAAAGDGLVSADTQRPDIQTAHIGALDLERQVQLATNAIERAAAGTLRAVIGAVFDLDDAASAHAAMEERSVIGKTLLRAR